jgi:hypothetical protein
VGPLLFWHSIDRFSTVTDFPTDSSGPAVVDIHDVPLVPTAAVITDVNGVPAVVGLSACCCWLTTFVRIFSCRPYCVGSPVVAFIPDVACGPAVVAVMILLLSFLLLLVAGITNVGSSLILLVCLLLLAFLHLKASL